MLSRPARSTLAANHSGARLTLPQRSDDRTAIFVTHGLGCRTIFSRLLTQQLGTREAIYCLQPPWLDGKEKPLTSVEEMAARYLEAVRPVQAGGPYVLAGFCAGGHLAMEMAHQLVANGEAVAHLFLIDTPVTVAREPFQALVAQQIAMAEQRRKLRPDARHLPDAIRIFAQALRLYEPRFFDGNVHILASRDLLPGMLDPEKGWRRLVRPDTVITVVAPTRAAIISRRMHVVARVMQRELSRGQLAIEFPSL